MTNQLTPAGFKYLASLYEACIDRGMHLGEIKDHLHQKGVTVSPSQIVYHLDNVFAFPGYAASHPAPPKLTYAELDALEEAKASKKTHTLVRAAGSQVVPFGLPLKQPSSPGQKILDKSSELGHNVLTNFCTTKETQ